VEFARERLHEIRCSISAGVIHDYNLKICACRTQGRPRAPKSFLDDGSLVVRRNDD
jgi:hypothetical protein